MEHSKDKMRLLFLADAVFEDLAGGSRAVARELAKGLARRGHYVTFLVPSQTSDAPNDENAGSYRIVRYQGAGGARQYVREGRQACARLWAREPFDLVHTHFAYAAVGPMQVVPKSVPRVRSFYGPWDEEAWIEDSQGCGILNRVKARIKKALRYRVERRDLVSNIKVWTLSDYSSIMVQERYGIASKQVEKIPGGTDLARFQPAANKPFVRNALGLPTDRTILLSIRRLAPRMGLDNLIRAMPTIVREHPDALLLIGGKGPERKRLEGLIRTLGMEANVRLIGFIPDAQLASYYQAVDLFVLPTIALEGFGLVTTEALACGVPVIGTPTGATPEVLSDLDPRLIAAGIDPASLSSCILNFLDGDWKQSLNPERLHRYVRDRYTWDKHVEAVETVYHRLLAGE